MRIVNCQRCNQPVPAGNRFCAACGAPVEGASGSPTASDTPKTTVLPPAAYGGGPSGRSTPRPSNAPPPPPSPPPTLQRPTTMTEHRRGGATSTVVIAIVGIVLLSVAAVGFVFYLTGRSGDTGAAATSSEAAPSAAEQARAIAERVAPAQDRLSARLESVEATKRSLRLIRGSAQKLEATADQALADARALAPDPADQPAVDAVIAMLEAERMVARAAVDLPLDPLNLTERSGRLVESASADAERSWEDLASVLAGVRTARVSADDTANFAAAGDRAAVMRDTKEFLIKMRGLFEQSSAGKSTIGTAVEKSRANCQIPPADASAQATAAANNRQSLLEQVSVLRVPDDPAAVSIATSFQRALSHSKAADEAYALWMTDLSYYYDPVLQMCVEAPPNEQNPNYMVGQSESSDARAAKEDTVRVYNAEARKYGLAANWTADRI